MPIIRKVVDIDFHFEPTTLNDVKKRLEKHYGNANGNEN